MAEHTPGPWTIEELGSGETDDGDAATLVTCFADDNGKEGATLAEVNRWSYGDDPPTPQSIANARLIAAAPDLLAACQAYVYGRKEPRECEAMMLAAIAKATGSDPNTEAK